MTHGTVREAASQAEPESRVCTVWNGSIVEVGIDSGPINLVNKELLRALNGALTEIVARKEARCLILHGGKARAFCAGSDIREFAHLRNDASEHVHRDQVAVFALAEVVEVREQQRKHRQHVPRKRRDATDENRRDERCAL